MADLRPITLKYASKCRACERSVEKGEQAMWEKEAAKGQSIMCMDCHEGGDQPVEAPRPPAPFPNEDLPF